ncbi:hypothetical protein PVAND_011013 [Polypedilum vanderplanki]|uniref:Transcription initiation factor IIA subunit 1 n=1 Tax=Polypedilum vanderplanki TaxID=319348 RepID=A0A9J6CI26_POLVA|nr:hypothetical protein PVAND_011013 [Polypedilum vanderplanki]
MAQTSASSSVLKLYQLVIEDVVANVRDAFLDEGVDEQVLQEMKQIWTNRLMASKAVEVTPEPQAPPTGNQPAILANNPKANGTKSKKAAAAELKNSAASVNGNVKSNVPPLAASAPKNTANTSVKNQQQTTNVIKTEPGQSTTSASVASTSATNSTTSAPSSSSSTIAAASQNGPPALQQTTLDPNKLIPIQITLPPQPPNETENRVLTIKVPARAIQENQLQQVITGEIITSIMPLQPSVASAVLQQHVTSVLNTMYAKNPLKLSRQVDGTAGDTSDEDGSDISDDHYDDIDDDDLNRDDDGSDINDADGGAEEEPLNSEDDVTDEDAADLFETDNVVVCQYDKINRSRNKWKFYLKDGIMNLNGKDYVFSKSNGDAEW